jgi:CcmD family protein
VEQLPAAPLVIGAYAFIWVALLVYVFLLWRRLGGVDRELAALRRSLEERQ